MTRNIPTIAESRRSFIEDGRLVGHFESASSRRVREAVSGNFSIDERPRFISPETTDR